MSERADEGVIRSWWQRWPGANVAVVTGSVSGVVVIDVDPRNGGEETLFGLQVDHEDLPPTLESETGGGGRHLWYAAPENAISSGELGPGVELKAERGIIVTPPSRHASGQTYRWLDYMAEPVPLPGWIGDVVQALGGPTPHQAAPPRTETERAEFREAWAKAGIELVDGDAYYLCPFHDDHHPSLHIDAEGCRWYCFACREGGGTGRLLSELGIDHAAVPRRRKTGWVGPRGLVTLTGDDEISVVGESFHQDELLAIAGGRRRFGGVDLRAIARLDPIEGDGIEVSIDGRPVGFLARDDTGRFAELIEESIERHGVASAQARIRGGWDRGGDDVGLLGVTLLLPEPATDAP